MMHIRDDDDDSNDFMTSMGSHHSYDSHNNPLGLSKAELRKVNNLGEHPWKLGLYAGKECSVVYS